MKLTNLQLELLKTISRPIDEKHLIEIKKLIAEYFAKNIDEEVDKLFEQNNWDESKIEEWSKGHFRTPYES